MNIRKALTPTVVAALTLLATPTSHAAEDDSGARPAWKYHCITCHGKKGVSNADRYPNLAGQNVTYLVSRLRYFRQGDEVGNQMNGHAKQLSDKDITTLAEYFNRPQD